MRKIFLVMLILLGIVTVAACQKGPKTHAQAKVPATSANDYSVTAKTYALPGEPSFRGNERDFFKNPLTAPANQTYYFNFASSEMRSEDFQALRIQARFLASHPDAKIRLEGNTDNRGSREYNIGLGWHRDQSVARMLEQQGVRPNQIQMVSYGKERPVLDENSQKAWALNRRVNLIYKVNS